MTQSSDMSLQDVAIEPYMCESKGCTNKAVNPMVGLCWQHKCRVPSCNNWAWYWRTTGYCVEHNNRGKYPDLHLTRYCITCGEESIPGTRECRRHIGNDSAVNGPVQTKTPEQKLKHQSKAQPKASARRASIMEDLRKKMPIGAVAEKYKVTTRTVYNARKEMLKDNPS